MSRCRIIGVGQPLAGDDGAGPAVIARLRAIALPAGIEAETVREPSALIPLLEATDPPPLVLVDAVLSEPPGQVLELSAREITATAPASVSSHGMTVGQALALAHAMRPARARPPRIQLVGISISRAQRGTEVMSAAVAAALPRAADLALALAIRSVRPVFERGG